MFIASFSGTEIYAHVIFLDAKLHLKMIKMFTMYDTIYGKFTVIL